MFVSKEHHAGLDRLRELIEAGQVRPVVDRTFPLVEVPDAMRLLAAGKVRGKIAITV
jgi:NADPH:quinone reductase-like Zn-dependent oxidoreductase